jgi:predicted nucleotidyltransferase
MILEEWRKFKGWDVLEFFLRTQKKIHLKGLAKELGVSPRTAQVYLHLYNKEGILEKESIGNLNLYQLKSCTLTRELKRLYILFKITNPLNQFVKDNPSITSLILYGSSAKGEYDNESDVDLLVVSNKKELNLSKIKKLEAELQREVKMEILSIGEIRKLAERPNNFYKSVSKNNIQLYGALP